MLGQRFRCHVPATNQRAIILLLEASPMPWTWQMLRDWFGEGVDHSIIEANAKRRIRRIVRGLYTSARKYESPVVTVSSALLERRFGIRC